MQHPIRLMLFGLASALLASVLAACGATVAQAQSCTMDFEASVRQGPDTGTSLIGNLSFQIDANGHLSGGLLTKNGKQIIASGQTLGQTISLIFDLGNDQHVFGVGALEHDMRDCSGVMGGPLTGPRPGDAGDWIGKAKESERP